MSPILLLQGIKIRKIMGLEERIRALVAEHFEGTDCFLADVKIANGGQKIAVFVDEMGKNISIDKCAKLSRLVEKTVEEEELVPEKYVLEVSSPGMSNPLKVPQQFQKHMGKEMTVLLKDGIVVEGFLKKYDGVHVEIEVHYQKNKKAPPEITKRSIELETVKTIKRKFGFK